MSSRAKISTPSPCTTVSPAEGVGAITRELARTLCAALCVPVLAAGCGSSTPPKIAEQPDVTVTLDGKRHACVVALANEPQGSIVSCKEVVPFLHDELRLHSGSIYDLRTIPDVDDAQIASTASALNGAGYRFIGGRKLP